MRQTRHYVGIDLGKTNIRARLYESGVRDPHSQSLSAVAEFHSLTPRDGVNSIIDSLATAISSLGKTPLAVGIGCFGIVDSTRGRVVKSGSLPFWNDVPLSALVTESTKIPCYVINDVLAAGIGIQASDRSRPRFALIQLGTSIGVTAGGKGMDWVVHAPNFGQISRMLSPDGSRWGEVLGGNGFAKRASVELGRTVSAMEVFEAEHDSASLALVHGYIESLAELASAMVSFIDPDEMVISGGVTRGLLRHEEHLLACYAERVAALWNPATLRISSLVGGPELGAALWAIEAMRNG